MAKTDTLHIRIEPSVKRKAEETLNDLGLSITEAINVFLNNYIFQLFKYFCCSSVKVSSLPFCNLVICHSSSFNTGK